MRLATTLLLLLLPLAGPAQTQTQTALLTLPNMPLHDPWLLANPADHTYYLYTSNIPALSGSPGAGTMAYRSTDLQHWQAPVIVFSTSTMHWAQAGAWAPEVHPWHGRFVLFTTVFDESKPLAPGKNASRPNYRRGTLTAIADTPLGPFTPLNPDAPVPPPNFMTLDGTLYTDPTGQPFMVYAHEWLQKNDGTIEAVPLSPDLARASGPPLLLFRGSDAPFLAGTLQPSAEAQVYVTDGPELFRTHTDQLLMLWSTYTTHDQYVETVARSRSGTLAGPWEQLPPLLTDDSGHGMLFRTFSGQLMLILHHPFQNARARLFDITDAGDHLDLGPERTDLDGYTPTHP